MIMVCILIKMHLNLSKTSAPVWIMITDNMNY